jgi:phage repressor protein C with HTH and peptisase S24 domain
MNLSQRLKAARKHANLTQKELADAAGVSQPVISQLEGGASLKSVHIAKLATTCKVDPLWLSEGVGEMLARRAHGPDENGSPSKKEYALIPQYTARASAGSGYHNDHVELTEGQGLVFKRDWLKRLSLKEESSCVIYAEGSSMEPTISDGDVLLIDRASTEPRNGKVYAIQRPDGSVSVKRLVQTFAGGWVVRSDNPDKTLYADEQISADDLQHVEIIGRSVWGGGGM